MLQGALAGLAMRRTVRGAGGVPDADVAPGAGGELRPVGHRDVRLLRGGVPVRRSGPADVARHRRRDRARRAAQRAARLDRVHLARRGGHRHALGGDRGCAAPADLVVVHPVRQQTAAVPPDPGRSGGHRRRCGDQPGHRGHGRVGRPRGAGQPDRAEPDRGRCPAQGAVGTPDDGGTAGHPGEAAQRRGLGGHRGGQHAGHLDRGAVAVQRRDVAGDAGGPRGRGGPARRIPCGSTSRSGAGSASA